MKKHPLYQPPENEDDSQINDFAIKQKTSERHDLVTVWLIIMMLGTFAAILAWMTNNIALLHLFPASLVYAVLGVLITEFICLLGIYYWYKLGVYGLVITLFTTVILMSSFPSFRASPTMQQQQVEMYSSLQHYERVLNAQSAGGLIFSLVMIYVFIRPNWEYYKGRKLIGFK